MPWIFHPRASIASLHLLFRPRSNWMNPFSTIILYLIGTEKKAESCDYNPLKAVLDKSNNAAQNAVKNGTSFKKLAVGLWITCPFSHSSDYTV